jgi:hypothetical protein
MSGIRPEDLPIDNLVVVASLTQGVWKALPSSHPQLGGVSPSKWHERYSVRHHYLFSLST